MSPDCNLVAHTSRNYPRLSQLCRLSYSEAIRLIRRYHTSFCPQTVRCNQWNTWFQKPSPSSFLTSHQCMGKSHIPLIKQISKVDKGDFISTQSQNTEDIGTSILLLLSFWLTFTCPVLVDGRRQFQLTASWTVPRTASTKKKGEGEKLACCCLTRLHPFGIGSCSTADLRGCLFTQLI